jgi:hypothetical protein
VPLSHRPNKVSATDFAQPPGERRDFGAFLDSLPHILEAAASWPWSMPSSRRHAQKRRGVVCMVGGHVVKTGLAPVLIDLARRGVITHFASNGSAVIHDYEVTRWGGTSEDVEAGCGTARSAWRRRRAAR